jgi:hypothetical protein
LPIDASVVVFAEFNNNDRRGKHSDHTPNCHSWDRLDGRCHCRGTGDAHPAPAGRPRIKDGASAAALADRLSLKLAADEDIAASDIVFAVVPPTAIVQVDETLADYRGIVIALIVDGTIGFDGNKSAAEQLAEALPNARVAGAFTSLWDAVVRNPGTSGKTSIFVFSDDEEARGTVVELCRRTGFRFDQRRQGQNTRCTAK